MAIEYDLLKTPLSSGETREFTLLGSVPISGEIRCFVQRPPPPGYKPCSACGSFQVEPNESISIHADSDVFSQNGGMLELYLNDHLGNEEKITLIVNRREDGTSESGQSGNSGSGGLEKMIDY